jgi:hypothetical protein
MVQALPFQAADKPFAVSVSLGGLNRRLEYLDFRALGNTRKQRTILVVPVTDEVFGALAPGCGFA